MKGERQTGPFEIMAKMTASTAELALAVNLYEAILAAHTVGSADERIGLALVAISLIASGLTAESAASDIEEFINRKK